MRFSEGLGRLPQVFRDTEVGENIAYSKNFNILRLEPQM